MKSRVENFFDKYAVDFNSIYENNNSIISRFMNSYLRKSMKMRFVKTMEGCYPPAGKSIIDIGCGAGQYAIALARNGAEYVYGIDFARGMIDLAKKNADQVGVGGKCRFDCADFISTPIQIKFDYAILMGVMDYIEKPKAIIEKALSVAKSKAFISFPAKGGILAWQRKLRYMKRCALFFYDREGIQAIFNTGLIYKDLKIEKIDRDFFVTVNLQ